jgi:CO/xanthine dehydrogenase FAD-binding subunit
MAQYARPLSLDEALALLSEGSPTILAGGTDIYPARVGKPLDDDFLDITGIDSLRGISDAEQAWRIGATSTWTDVIEADLPPAFDGLKQAAAEVGGVQIQNAGTIAGNLCNASPAADGVPPLLSLDAAVELASTNGTRHLPLSQFILGNRDTALKADELLTALLIPKTADGAISSFLKLGARKYLVISIAMVAVVIEPQDGVVANARVALGSCSAVAQRLPEVEAALQGEPVNGTLGKSLIRDHLGEAISPISDVRGSADYRLDAAVTLVRRALGALGAGSSDDMERAA